MMLWIARDYSHNGTRGLPGLFSHDPRLTGDRTDAPFGSDTTRFHWNHPMVHCCEELLKHLPFDLKPGEVRKIRIIADDP